MTTVSDYLDSSLIKNWLQTKPEYLERVGEVVSLDEVGDGNLNFVWIIKGTKGAIVAKRAPPFVRILPDWTLKAERAWYEYQVLVEENKWAPGVVPEVYGYDKETETIVMEYLTPHIILRKGLIAATEYPLLAEHMAEFLAQTLFHTSDLYLPNHVKRQQVKKFHTNELVHLTEQVIFHEPYTSTPNNSWTDQPELHDVIESLQSDDALKSKVGGFHYKFQNDTQALLHGSVMVTPERTCVIDPEFGYYGPMGFDIGSFLANLFMSFFSQNGWQEVDQNSDREFYAQWLLKVVEAVWDGFTTKFKALWNTKHEGSLFSNMKGTPGMALAQETFLRGVFVDTLAYTGIEIIRRLRNLRSGLTRSRIVGVASVADFQTIPRDDIRAGCEVKALKFARDLVAQNESFKTIQEVVERASTLHQ